MAKRHAEIAGGGIGGFALAAALAQRGWTVQLHEQAPELRELVIGLGVWHNGQRACKALGVLDQLIPGASTLTRWEMIDETQQIVAANPSGLIVLLRTDLHRALIVAAQKAGVQVLTSSRVTGADPAGALIMEGGKRLKADLVVGADGYNSKVRDSLGLAERVSYVTDSVLGRAVVPRLPDETTAYGCEHWSGPRRAGTMVCGPNLLNLFLSSPPNQAEINNRRVDKELWTRHYPHLRPIFDRISDDADVRWDRYPHVVCKAWSSGRAAIIGDAAHAVPPTVAQGAGFALTDAVTLAAAVDRGPTIPEALQRWEARERPVIDGIQKVGVLLVLVNKLWPLDLLPLRSEFLKGVLHTKEAAERITAAARHMLDLDPTMAVAGE